MTSAKELTGDMSLEEDGVNSSHSGRSSPPDLRGVGDGEKGVAAGLRDEGGGRRAWVMVVGHQRRERGGRVGLGALSFFLDRCPIVCVLMRPRTCLCWEINCCAFFISELLLLESLSRVGPSMSQVMLQYYEAYSNQF
jgi:hypothetical protein